MSDVVRAVQERFRTDEEISCKVRRELDARAALGNFRYGVPLDPWDRRDWLKEAFDEIQDTAIYLEAEQFKNGLDADLEQAYALVRQLMLVLARKTEAQACEK